MGSVFQNGFAHKANFHQVAGTYSNPPKGAESGMLKCPPVCIFVQGIKLTQSPYMAFQFSNLVQQVSQKNGSVGNEGIKKMRREHILFKIFLMFIYFWDRERQSVSGEGQKERETQNLKQRPGSKLSAQSLTRDSNSQTMRSWPKPKLDGHPTEPSKHPGGTYFVKEPTVCQALQYIHISSFSTPKSSKYVCLTPFWGDRLRLQRLRGFPQSFSRSLVLKELEIELAHTETAHLLQLATYSLTHSLALYCLTICSKPLTDRREKWGRQKEVT